MGWAFWHIDRLQNGKQFLSDLEGKINSGQLCTVAPVLAGTPLKKGDIVPCKVGFRAKRARQGIPTLESPSTPLRVPVKALQKFLLGCFP